MQNEKFILYFAFFILHFQFVQVRIIEVLGEIAMIHALESMLEEDRLNESRIARITGRTVHRLLAYSL